LHKILLDILTFVNAAKVKIGSLKVWIGNIQSYKISPKSANSEKK